MVTKLVLLIPLKPILRENHAGQLLAQLAQRALSAGRTNCGARDSIFGTIYGGTSPGIPALHAFGWSPDGSFPGLSGFKRQGQLVSSGLASLRVD